VIEMTGVESKIEGLIEILREDEGRILEICRSGKMTMRRGHHTSSVMKAMGVGVEEPVDAIVDMPEEKVPTEID
jgi:acetolactate synthase-1/3 small subunit